MRLIIFNAMSWRSNKLKIFVFILILVFASSLLVHKISFHTDDLGRHLKNGEMVLQGNFDVLKTNFYSYVQPNSPFVNDHWLSGVIFYLLYRAFGFSGLIIFTAAFFLFAFSLLFWIATQKADFWLVAALSIPTILILRERTDVRPEIFSYLFIAIFLYFLFSLEECCEKNRVFWLIPLQFLWVNLHTFFIVGPMLVMGFLAEKVILNYRDLRENALIKKLVMLLGALIVVSFINPNGVAGVLRPFFRLTGYRVWVTEDQALMHILSIKPVEDISVIIFTPLVLFLAFSFIFGFRKKQRPIFYGLASIGTIAASFSIVRTLPLFGLIFLPAISENFNRIFITIKYRIKKFLAPALMTALAGFIFFGVQGKISKYDEPGLGLTPRSNDAAIFFKEQGLRGPIFNDAAIGSYLIWHFFPEERVFFDNRHADAYSGQFMSEVYRPMLTQEEKWREMQERYSFNAIFFFHYDEVFNSRQFLARRMRDPDWAAVYADNNAIILLRNNKENQEKIEKFQITKDNVGERMKYLLESRDVDDWIAAADIFNLIDRGDLALSVYQEVVLREPRNSKIWRIMGETAVLRNNEKSDILAVIYLERAIALGQKNANAYTRLGLAYFRLSRFEEAKEILQKALKRDPNREDAKEYLEKLHQYMETKFPSARFTSRNRYV